jgi:thioredoxin reductase
VRHASVSSIVARPDELFDVALSDGSLVAHRVVLATGVRDVFPSIRGFDEHYGASVFHCPACDGYEARDRDVVAIGWDRHLVGFASTLLNWARSVTVVTDGHRFPDDEACRAMLDDNGIELVEQDAVEFVGTRGARVGPVVRRPTPADVSGVLLARPHPAAVARVSAGLPTGR